MRWARRLFGVCWAAFFLSGCARVESPITCDVRDVDLGIVTDENFIGHTFTLKVWGSGNVEVRSVDKSCGCMEVDDGLIGATLESGAQRDLRLNVDTAGMAGEVIARANVVTAPAIDPPLILTIRAFIKNRVKPTPESLLAKIVQGSSPTWSILLKRVRDTGTLPLELDLGRSDLCGLDLLDQRLVSTALEPSGGQVARGVLDDLTLELGMKESLSLGEHQFPIKLAWRGKEDSTQAVLSVRVIHSLGPSVDRVFIGDLSPGESRSAEVRLTSAVGGSIDLKSISCDNGLAEAYLDERCYVSR